MLTISFLIKNLVNVVLPSSLWAIHFDPHKEFFSVVQVIVNCGVMKIHKGALLKIENTQMTVIGFVNEKLVKSDLVESISDLNNFIQYLDQLKPCKQCSKFVLDLNSICASCSAVTPVVVTPKISCTNCGKTFPCLTALNCHMSTHLNEKLFKCKQCSKSFSKKYNLNTHSRVHSGERPFVCGSCGKTYTTRSNLSTHINSTHRVEKKHRCDICEMSFVHPRILRIHMRKHTGEKPYMCQICGKVFAKNIHLTIHTRTHTGEKPFICENCGKTFTTSGNLNTHRKTHSNFAPNMTVT